MQDQKTPDTKLQEDYAKVQAINKERRRRFIESSRRKQPAVEEKKLVGTEMVATLRAINRYEKLVFSTADDNTIDQLMTISEGYKNIESTNKKPIWSDEDGVIWFKTSVPKFMTTKLFKWQQYVGNDLKFTIESRSYDHEQYGQGFYLSLSSDLKQVHQASA